MRNLKELAPLTKVIFMGTPDFAVPSLIALINGGYHVVAVVTQPDRPSGRGKKLMPSPVKVAAQQAGIAVLQPATLKSPEAVAQLAALAPDVMVVAAFGQILRANVLALPRSGCLNVHASLLPRWRGAAPIAAAINAGDAETGVTLMLMDEGLDTGPMLARRAVPITQAHTGDSLTVELAQVGASLLVDTLPAWLAGAIEPQPQDNSRATLAPRLKKEAGEIDWQWPAEAIERQVRAFFSWPGAYTQGPRGPLKILETTLAPDIPLPAHGRPGLVFQHQKNVYVAAGSGALQLVTVQPAGKNPMPAAAMVNGQPELVGICLGVGVN